jgi:hypothetical protein
VCGVRSPCGEGDEGGRVTDSGIFLGEHLQTGGVMSVRRSPRCMIHKPALYRIRVHGRMRQEWSERLQGMTIATIPNADDESITELSGVLPDQAALMGVLQQLYTCGAPLLSVECLGSRDEEV